LTMDAFLLQVGHMNIFTFQLPDVTLVLSLNFPIHNQSKPQIPA
jgi:hypothetical protein